MFSAHDQPTRPEMRTLGPSIEAEAEIAERALDDEIEAIENADGDRMLGAGVFYDDGAVAVLHQASQTKIDGVGGKISGVDLGTLVEIDIEGARQAEAVARLVQIDIEKLLQRAAAKLLGMHAHLMGHALLL